MARPRPDSYTPRDFVQFTETAMKGRTALKPEAFADLLIAATQG